MQVINLKKQRYYLRRIPERRLYKIDGYFHSDAMFRFMLSYLEDIPWHTFVVSVNRSNQLYGLPTNVLPCVYLDLVTGIDKSLVEEYLEGRPNPICSTLVLGHTQPPDVRLLSRFNWLLLSGTTRNVVLRACKKLNSEIPIYVERVQHSTKLGQEYIRKVPKWLQVNGEVTLPSME